MIEAWAFWLAVAFAIVLAVILLVKIVVGWWHGKGKRRLEGANRALVDAAYDKAGSRVEARVKLLRAEAQAEDARQAEALASRIPRLFEEDASGGPPPAPPHP